VNFNDSLTVYFFENQVIITNFNRLVSVISKGIAMEDSKINPKDSFANGNTKEHQLKASLSRVGKTEVDVRNVEESSSEMPHGLPLDMEITREEFEILYTRL